MKRCEWAKSDLEIHYHDHHWCRVQHEDTILFEMLILEGLQAGLSWSLILKRWDGLKEILDNFDVNKIALYDNNKKETLLKNDVMIKNKRKIDAIITNAICFIKVQQEYGSFDKYIWSFTNNKQIVHHFKSLDEVPSYDELSTTISKDLKKKGFKFVGPTIIYSYLQSIGIINDHLVDCPCFQECIISN